jgi:hypothetical protein
MLSQAGFDVVIIAALEQIRSRVCGHMWPLPPWFLTC